MLWHFLLFLLSVICLAAAAFGGAFRSVNLLALGVGFFVSVWLIEALLAL